jgi:hypothetical protein
MMRGLYSIGPIGETFVVDHPDLDALALYTVRWSHFCTLLTITPKPAAAAVETGPDFESWRDALASAAWSA